MCLQISDPFTYDDVTVSLVLTAPCRLVSEDQCCESTLGRIFTYGHLPDPSHLARETQPWDLASRLLSHIKPSRSVDERNSLLSLLSDANSESTTAAFQEEKVYIYCAPCLCQIWTAFRICDRAPGPIQALFQLCVRIDDRLPATCCQVSSCTAGLAAIVDQIRSIEMDGKHLYPSYLGKHIKYIDRDWIDQRLDEQADEVFQMPAGGAARSLSFIFDRLPSRDLAAVIILGERDHLVPMLQYSPFQTSERVLRENEFFQVKRERVVNEWSWSLKYLGRFTAKKSPSAQTGNSSSSHPQSQQHLQGTSITAATSNSRSREASPSTNASVKRRRTETTSDN